MLTRLAYELVAEAVHGENVLRMARVGLDLLPKPGDVDVDRARRGHGVVAPDFVEQLVARQRRAAVLDEVAQQLEFTRRQLNLGIISPHFGFTEVDRDVAEGVLLRGDDLRGCRRAADL